MKRNDSGDPDPGSNPLTGSRVFYCDRCGQRLASRHCKQICTNCGAQLDCSDLKINFDED